MQVTIENILLKSVPWSDTKGIPQELLCNSLTNSKISISHDDLGNTGVVSAMIVPRIFPSTAHPQEFPNQTQAGSLATAEFIIIYLVPRKLKGLRVLKGISWKTFDDK